MNEAAHTISLISPSKCHLALIGATVITSFIVLRVEWNETVSDLSRAIRHQEIFEPQPGNFGGLRPMIIEVLFVMEVVLK